MATPAQVIANRANAQLSTGPRSVEGKAASSRNALKLGIHAKSWFMERVTRIEADVVHARLAAQQNPGPHALGDIYIDDFAAAKLFDSLARRYQSLQRDYYRALKEIRECKRARAEAARFAATLPQPENRLRFSNPTPIPPPPPLRAPLGNPALRL